MGYKVKEIHFSKSKNPTGAASFKKYNQMKTNAITNTRQADNKTYK